MKKIKKIIFVVIILVFFIISIIIFIKKNNNVIDVENVISDKESMGVGEFSEEFLEKVKIDEVIKIKSCVDKFLESTNVKSYTYFGKDENGEEKQFVSDEFIRNRVLNFLSENYKIDNNISANNIEQYIKFSDIKREFNIINIKRIKNQNLNQYIVQVDIIVNNKLESNMNYVVTLDSKQGIFSIYPLKIKDTNIEDIKVQEEAVAIKNKDNSIPLVPITQEETAKFYLKNMKYMLLYNVNEAYKHLEDEYKKKRFVDLEYFNNYAENNSKEIKELDLVKYKINADNSNIEYLLMDKYERVYVINITNEAIKYKFQLDTYTINSEKFIKAYDEGNNEYKVKLNIDKWIKMLNSRDYKNAYKYLDETFRSNNFDTEEKFEQYMREEFPLHYKLSVGKFEEINGTYTQKIVLKDITGESEEEIENTIIMKLKDNYEFVMSFEIK